MLNEGHNFSKMFYVGFRDDANMINCKKPDGDSGEENGKKLWISRL
jgi:hypothetical protein